MQGSASYLIEFTGPPEVKSASLEVLGSASLCVQESCQAALNPRAVFGAQLGAWNFTTRAWDLLGVTRSQGDSNSEFKLRAESPDARGVTHLLDLGGGRHRVIVRLWFEPGDPALATRFDIDSVTLLLK